MLTPDNFREYQHKIINHIFTHYEANVFVFAGGGKTVSLLTAYLYLKRAGYARKVLIVCPKQVAQLTWSQEIENWSHLISAKSELRISKILGSAKQKQSALFSDADIYITNYESLTWMSEQLLTYFIECNYALPFDMIVFDEVSKMKRRQSNRFKAFVPILPYFYRRVGLTASPASNGLENTWGISYVTDLGKRLGTVYSQFLQKFFKRRDGEHANYDARKTTKVMIVNALADNTIVIEQDDSIDLPPLTTNKVYVQMTPKQMRGYVELERELITRTEAGEEISLMDENGLAVKLLQYADGRVYNTPDPDQPDYREVIKVHNHKFDAFEELYDSINAPMLLAYNFQSEKDELLYRYPDAKCLVGIDDHDEINAIQDEFNAGDLRLLITHPMSSGYGLNLQKACNNIVNFGLMYNFELWEQMIFRVYRQGNDARHIMHHIIMTKDTNDDIVLKLLEQKGLTQQGLKEALQIQIKQLHESR